MSFILPAGEYFIGDPYYSIKDSEWDDFVDNLDDDLDKIQSYKNCVFCSINTQYGDGTYLDNLSRKFGVDSGMIAALPRALIDEQDAHKEYSSESSVGHWVTFDEPVKCGIENGVIYFGNLTIETDDYDYEQEQEEEDSIDYEEKSESDWN